jgi:hypothetical protein
MTRNKTLKQKRYREGCLTDCVAYYFNYHPQKVPLFIHPKKNWHTRLKRFFKYRGYEIMWERTNKAPKTGRHIMVVDGYGEDGHALVYKNGKLAYDPAYPSRSRKNITHRLIIKKRKSD